MRSASVELHDVSKSYGNVQALHSVSLRIERGEVVAVLGPNGAGKSTSIAIMLGLRRPTTGQALLFGEPPGSRRARSRIGVMLQESGVPPTLKVRELIDLFRTYYPRPLSTEELLLQTGLDDKANTLLGTLSGGQKQRVYFALAICGDPEVLFLDEPTNGLDVESRRVFWDRIREFATRGATIVLTTHNLQEADALAHRIVVIDKGRIVADDTPSGIKARTAGKHISFTTGHPLPLGFFDDLPLSRLAVNESAVTFVSSEPEVALKRVFRTDCTVSDLEITAIGLEEAVLSLTGRNGSSGVEASRDRS
ncbi:MAG: type transport system ATP-binding protein [Chloroflexota bacterium]|jgi:ABC-2 type transport system ATP-binding protein|nr:type transport system ATP-binding protein [Chloroflexota bacterium]